MGEVMLRSLIVYTCLGVREEMLLLVEIKSLIFYIRKSVKV